MQYRRKSRPQKHTGHHKKRHHGPRKTTRRMRRNVKGGKFSFKKLKRGVGKAFRTVRKVARAVRPIAGLLPQAKPIQPLLALA